MDSSYKLFRLIYEAMKTSAKKVALDTIQEALKMQFPDKADAIGEIYSRNILPTRLNMHSHSFAYDTMEDIFKKILKALLENEAITGGDFIPINFLEKLSKQALGKVCATALPVLSSIVTEVIFLYKKSQDQNLSSEEWHGLLVESMMTVISNGAVNCALALFTGPVGWAASGAKLVVSGVVSYLSGKAGYDIGYSCRSLEQVKNVMLPNAFGVVSCLSGKAGYDIGYSCRSLEQVKNVMFPNAFDFCQERNCLELFSGVDLCLDPLPPSIL